YAWQITALNGASTVSKSEVWTFRVKKDAVDTSSVVYYDHYASLNTDQNASFTICKGVLKYVYHNELNDISLPFRIFDITAAHQKELTLDSTVTDIRYGDNFNNLDFSETNLLTDKHVYLFETINSKNEKWYLRFQYRKPD